METRENHSTYKGYQIVKVTQDNGRVTYDTRTPDGQPDTWANGSLAIARAQIDAEVQG